MSERLKILVKVSAERHLMVARENLAYCPFVTRWFEEGCERCRDGIVTRGSDAPRVVGSDLRECAFLRRCDRCGAWWREGQREAHVISDEQARLSFASLFRD